MTTPLPSWPPRSTDRRTAVPLIAVPREPLDPARTGRRWVRRRARGMTADAAAAALDAARFDARQNSRHEDLAVDERGPAEVGEWERIARRVADAPPGTVYDPDTDDVVQAELAADAAAAAARESAARLLTPPVLVHAALLAELARLVPDANVGQLAFAARIATTEPEATAALAAHLTVL